MVKGFSVVTSRDGSKPEHDVVELDEVKARSFLKTLATRPFVTVVVDKGGVFRVYTKGMTEDAARDVLHGTVRQMDAERQASSDGDGASESPVLTTARDHID